MILQRFLSALRRVPGEAWLLAGVLLLALVIRLYRLDGQSLWYDEGTSVALAGRDLITITRDAAADIHPPLYYYLLHGWVRFAGTSEAGVRSLSTVLGLAVVGLTYLLARRLFGVTPALLAALFSAISPFQVYYSQETRMYILVTCLGVLSVYLTVTWMDEGEVQGLRHSSEARNPARSSPLAISALLYTLSTALALYTHYFAFTLIVAENLALGTWWVITRSWRSASGRRLMAGWLAAQIAVVVLFTPWLLVTWEQIQRWPAVSAPFTWGFLLTEVLRIFPLGLSVPKESTWLTWAMAGVLLLGALPGPARSRWRQDDHRVSRFPCFDVSAPSGWALVVVLCYALVPVLAMWVLSLRRPMYNPKFLLLATPAYYIMLARGVLAPIRLRHRGLPRELRRAAVAALAALVVLPAGASLRNYYFDPAYARDNYRGIARYVEAAGRPGDAVILNAPSQIEVFSYYYAGDLPLYPLPQQRPPNRSQTESALEGIATRQGRVFAVLWATDESDPERIVEGWLDDHGYKALEAWYGNVRLAMWAMPPQPPANVQYPLSTSLGDQVTLLGYSLPEDSVAAGDVLPLTLYWTARARLTERYKVFVHLLDARDRIIGQRDSEPGGGVKLTTSWEPGQVITDNYGVLVPFGTPPGEARLVVGMYHYETGQRLPVSGMPGPGDDRVFLRPVRIVKPEFAPPVEALGLDRRVDAGFGPLRLLGYVQRRMGAEHDPRAPLRPGDAMNIILFWLLDRPATGPVQVSLRLIAGDGRVQSAEQSPPAAGTYPLGGWEPGELVRDQHHLGIPPDTPAGRYRLVIEVQEGDLGLGNLVLREVVIE